MQTTSKKASNLLSLLSKTLQQAELGRMLGVIRPLQQGIIARIDVDTFHTLDTFTFQGSMSR